MNNIILSEKSQELVGENNCFDFIRYFFTISIFIGHFLELSDISKSWFISGATGVKAFFIISGFLIFYSHIQKQSLRYYIDKRIRRILPPYVSVVLLCVIAGFFLTELNFSDYISSKETYKYLIANLSFMNFIQPTLPGVFESNPIQAINGSLWTMKVEVLFYVSVPFIFFFLKKINKIWVLISIFVFSMVYDYCFTALYEYTNNNLYLLIRKQIGSQLVYFYSGTFILLYFDYFTKYLKYIFPIAIFIFIFRDNVLLSNLEALAFATILISVAYHFKYMNFLRKYDNISYGMYLYHFPIIQAIVYYKIPQYNIYLAFILALILTVLVSMLSWKFIEKPIIKNKLFRNK